MCKFLQKPCTKRISKNACCRGLTCNLIAVSAINFQFNPPNGVLHLMKMLLRLDKQCQSGKLLQMADSSNKQLSDSHHLALVKRALKNSPKKS